MANASMAGARGWIRVFRCCTVISLTGSVSSWMMVAELELGRASLLLRCLDCLRFLGGYLHSWPRSYGRLA